MTKHLGDLLLIESLRRRIERIQRLLLESLLVLKKNEEGIDKKTYEAVLQALTEANEDQINNSEPGSDLYTKTSSKKEPAKC